MKTLKNIVEGIAILVFWAFVAASIYFIFHGIGSGKWRVFVPSGDTTIQYRTDSIRNVGNGCIEFESNGTTRRVCGSYTLKPVIK